VNGGVADLIDPRFVDPVSLVGLTPSQHSLYFLGQRRIGVDHERLALDARHLADALSAGVDHVFPLVVHRRSGSL
jgi:hypothetical protein